MHFWRTTEFYSAVAEIISVTDTFFILPSNDIPNVNADVVWRTLYCIGQLFIDNSEVLSHQSGYFLRSCFRSTIRGINPKNKYVAILYMYRDAEIFHSLNFWTWII